MQQCWRTKPEDRPTFEELVASISPMLEVVSGYTELSMTLAATTMEEQEQQVVSEIHPEQSDEDEDEYENCDTTILETEHASMIDPTVESNPSYQLHCPPEQIPLSTNPGYKSISTST